MYPRVSPSWVDPAIDLGLPGLTAQQAEMVRGSMCAVSKNYVIHLHVRPAGEGVCDPNAIWNAMRWANSSGSTSSYGDQLSMRLFLPDLDTTCTIMTSRESRADTTANAVSEVCILGVKDASTTYVVAHYMTTDFLYRLTGIRYAMVDIKLCNTLFVAAFPGVTVDIVAMARTLTAVHCIIHSNIEMVTLTVEIETESSRDKKRTATCNVWTTGSINVMGVPNEVCCRVALEKVLPLVVRFVRAVEAPVAPKPAPVPRSMQIPPLDRQCSWGSAVASQFCSRVTKVDVHPRAKSAKEPENLFIRPGMPLPLVSVTQRASTPGDSHDSESDEGEFAL